jgi:signal recognition particle receptor subunit beta
MIRAKFDVRFLDREKPVAVEVNSNKNGVFTAESVARVAAASVLKASPARLELFALKSGSDISPIF